MHKSVIIPMEHAHDQQTHVVVASECLCDKHCIAGSLVAKHVTYTSDLCLQTCSVGCAFGTEALSNRYHCLLLKLADRALQ